LLLRLSSTAPSDLTTNCANHSGGRPPRFQYSTAGAPPITVSRGKNT
jgi:hypothetical protein